LQACLWHRQIDTDKGISAHEKKKYLRAQIYKRYSLICLGLLLALGLITGSAGAAPQSNKPSLTAPISQNPSIQIALGDMKAGAYASAIKIVIFVAILSVAPAIILSVTSFTRIIIVFSFTRQALGVQQLPPNQILIGLALFLTLFTMMPVIKEIDANALQKYQHGEINEDDALKAALKPLKKFMLKHTGEGELKLFLDISQTGEDVESLDAMPIHVLIPSFMLSELKVAFKMGSMIFIPFLIIDMVVSSILMAMGMMMLPPVSISLPIKLILFVMVNGWELMISSLAKSIMQ
jgi:flagellar biosynthetic protein FliP